MRTGTGVKRREGEAWRENQLNTHSRSTFRFLVVAVMNASFPCHCDILLKHQYRNHAAAAKWCEKGTEETELANGLVWEALKTSSIMSNLSVWLSLADPLFQQARLTKPRMEQRLLFHSKLFSYRTLNDYSRYHVQQNMYL